MTFISKSLFEATSQMRHMRTTGFVVCLSAGLAAVTAPNVLMTARAAPLSQPSFHPRRVLVRFKAAARSIDKLSVHQVAGAAGTLREYHVVPGLELVELDHDDVQQAIAAYRGSADVLYAEPDFIVHADVVPNDSFFDVLWGLRNTGQAIGAAGTPGADIRAADAWNLWIGDPNFKIAVIDTGVNYYHPDLGPNIWTNPGEIADNGIDDEGDGYIDDIHGYDFVNDDGDPMDDHRHGSHTAGTIGAVGNNNEGVVGVNWQCKIVALKFLGAGGSGWTSDAMLALQYAIDHGIKVSNNSWGGGGYSQAMYDTIEASQAVDHIFVAAAGNLADNLDGTPHYPAAYDLPNIITVAATDSNDGLASFSNWGPTAVDLGAPGVLIYSTFLGTDYSYLSGTSMAAPHVAGVVALLMSRDPTLTWQIAKDRILQTARPVSALEGRTVTGGVLNAVAALGDCNVNGIDDAVDIATGASEDCTGNGTPDECEPDCNGNSIADSCDIAAGTSSDCDGLGAPDECEPDCNANGVADQCDISFGSSGDCNFDGVPDDCQPGGTEDCDGNGTADLCDLFLGLAFDCNENDIPDACDLHLGVSEDCNGNLVPDECDVAPDALLSVGIAGWDFAKSISDLGYDVVRADRTAFPADLSFFEVIILGPGGVPYDSATIDDIDAFVAGGGTMIRIQDGSSYHVQYGGEARPILGAEGWSLRAGTQIVDPSSPLTAGLSTTSTLTGYSAAYTLKPGAEVVLAWDDGEAMTVYYEYGTGKVIYFNDLWAAYMHLWEGDTAYGLALMENALNERKAPELDCNRNGNPDMCDLSSGTSDDCTGNGIPDECELDCNGNLVADICDLVAGTSEDCSGNGIPDECEPDCNGNLVADSCDIVAGTSEDCTGNWTPDECEADCNTNGVADSCDILNGTSSDVNGNGQPDECGLVLHVDLSATGQGNGLTWADAFTDLQQALAMASSLSAPDFDLAIWIAAGTYTPSFRTDPADPRTATFQLVNDVRVFGGFTGDETSLADRDFRSNVVVLTGDLSGDDGPGFANNAENAYHVVTGSNTDSNAVLDGVTITGGFAYEGTWGDRTHGAGVIIDGGSATLVHCTVTANRAFIGAGMLVRNGGATIANGTFAGNQAGLSGGGIENAGGTILVVNSIFSGNTAGDDPDRYGRGAGLNSIGTASAVVTNCVFVGNHAYGGPLSGEGGGLSAYGSSVTATVANSIFWDNTVDGSGSSAFSAQISTKIGAVTNVDFSCVFGWDSSLGGVGNTGSNPQFVDSDGPDNVWGTLDDDFHLSANSPCIDAGDNAAVPADLVDLDGDSDFAEPLSLDLDGHRRFSDDVLTPDSGNGASPIVDMGVYEPGSCGNGIVDFGEDCDDGATQNNDGCSAVCVMEDGWACTGEPSFCGNDCNGNGMPDEYEIPSGSVVDCPPPFGSPWCDAGPFFCAEPGCDPDCNSNGIPDECDVASGISYDCQMNGIPDICDIAGGEPDDNGNGILDQCEPSAPLPAPYPHGRRKNRYISFDPDKLNNDGINVAFKVTLTAITLGSCSGGAGDPAQVDFCRVDRGADDCNTCAGALVENACINQTIDCTTGTCTPTGETCVNDAPNSGGSNVGTIWWVGPENSVNPSIHLLVSQSFRKESTNWANPVHAGDCEVVPEARYGIRAVGVGGGSESAELLVETARFATASSSWWGDCVGQLKKFCGGDIRTPECAGDGDCTAPDACDRAWTLPDNSVNFDDVNAALALVAPGATSVAPDPTWVDLHGNGSGSPGSQNFDPPNGIANFPDIGQIISAFGGFPYKGYDPADCPDVGVWP